MYNITLLQLELASAMLKTSKAYPVSFVSSNINTKVQIS